MRRAMTLLVFTMIAAVIALPAVASDDPAADPIILAVSDGDLGPDPQPRLSEGNAARELAGYESPDVPFTWGAAWILTFAGLAGLTLLIGLYYFGVYRPRQESGN